MNVIPKLFLAQRCTFNCRSLHSSAITYKQAVKHTEFVGKLKQPRKQYVNFQKRGDFKDIPEWSFLDGRPAPPGMAKTRRREAQKQICLRIIELNREIERVTTKTTRRQRKLNQYAAKNN